MLFSPVQHSYLVNVFLELFVHHSQRERSCGNLFQNLIRFKVPIQILPLGAFFGWLRLGSVLHPERYTAMQMRLPVRVASFANMMRTGVAKVARWKTKIRQDIDLRTYIRFKTDVMDLVTLGIYLCRAFLRSCWD